MSSHNAVPGSNSSAKTMGVLSLVLGVLSILFALFVPLLGFLLSIAAVVVGFISRRREVEASGLALGGIITGFIGFVLSVIGYILGVVALNQQLQQG
jgi:ABC-type Fe3+-siderophore transport system permease subunit